MEFTCVDQSATHCTLALKDNEKTRACYPFAFELLITHTLQDQTLVITYALRNPSDDKELLASVGAHPGFKWPLTEGADRNAHTITFEQDELAPIRRLDSGLVQAQTFPTPVHNRVLVLRDALFVADVIMFDALKSRSLTYTAPGAPKIHISFPGFPHLGLWTKPGAGFVCIEPWQGHASPETFEGEFRDKPGVVSIAPKAEKSWQYSISVEA
jgi:galactose mutarotase-like enzyme